MDLAILPLAVTMMAGPQIMSALMLTTSKRPVTNSLAFVIAVLLTASVGVFLYSLVGTALHQLIALRDQSGPTTAAKITQLVLVGILVLLAFKAFRGRKTAKQPKWMESLINARPKKAFKIGVLLIFLMPTDIVVMLTVGVNLTSNHLHFSAALPFLLVTALIAALPLLVYLLFYRKARTLMPKARDWMLYHSWLINIFVYALFIYLILK